MKKFDLFLAFITIVIVLSLAWLYVSGFSKNEPGDEASKIALNDPMIKGYLVNHTYDSSGYGNDIYRIESITSTNDTGYINSTDEYRKVTILVTGTMDYMDTIRLQTTVDLTKKEVVEVQPVHMIAWVPEIHAVISPGAYWYHLLTSMGLMSIGVRQSNATAYIALLTEDNFEKFRYNEPYVALVYDPDASKWVNTTTPFEGNVSLGGVSGFMPGYNDTVYLVVKNGNTGQVINVDGTA